MSESKEFKWEWEEERERLKARLDEAFTSMQEDAVTLRSYEEKHRALKAEVERAHAEIQGVLDYMPMDAVVKSTKDGIYASLAISVAKLAKLREEKIDEVKRLKAKLSEARKVMEPFEEFYNATGFDESKDHIIISEWFHANGMTTSVITHGHCRAIARWMEDNRV